MKHILELQERQATENVTLKLLNKEKASTERALQNLLTAIENGIYSNTTNKRLHELEAQQAELEKQIIIEQSKCAIRVPESMVRSYYKDILKSEPQMLINLLIKRITVYPDRIEIEYNSPLKTSPDENRGFLICRKIYKIGQFKTVVILKI